MCLTILMQDYLCLKFSGITPPCKRAKHPFFRKTPLISPEKLTEVSVQKLTPGEKEVVEHQRDTHFLASNKAEFLGDGNTLPFQLKGDCSVS